MLLCGLSVLGLLVLIVYELVLHSGPSWHAFGFKFFAGHDWDPVNEQFGAMPFIYGTLVSSLLALIIAVPLSIGCRRLHHRNVPRKVARAALILRGITGRNSQRGLRVVGDLCADSPAHQICRTFSCANVRLDRTFRGTVLRSQHAGRGSDSGHHDRPHHLVDCARSAHGCSPAPA